MTHSLQACDCGHALVSLHARLAPYSKTIFTLLQVHQLYHSSHACSRERVTFECRVSRAYWQYNAPGTVSSMLSSYRRRDHSCERERLLLIKITFSAGSIRLAPLTSATINFLQAVGLKLAKRSCHHVHRPQGKIPSNHCPGAVHPKDGLLTPTGNFEQGIFQPNPAVVLAFSWVLGGTPGS